MSFTDQYEGKAAARTTGFFKRVLNSAFGSGDIQADLEKLETAIQHYEESSSLASATSVKS